MTDTATQIPLKHKSYYAGTVKNQSLVYTGKEGEEVTTLILTVGLEGQLIDPYDPDKGTQRAPAIDVDVMLRFDPYGNMESAIDDLARLGFDSEDLEVLHPEHKKHVSFIGKKVHVSPSFTTKRDREVIYWNLRFPKKFENKPVAKTDLGKSAAATAFRELMARRKAEQTQPSF